MTLYLAGSMADRCGSDPRVLPHMFGTLHTFYDYKPKDVFDTLDPRHPTGRPKMKRTREPKAPTPEIQREQRVLASEIRRELESRWPGAFLFIGSRSSNHGFRLFEKTKGTEYEFPRIFRRNVQFLEMIRNEPEKLEAFLKTARRKKTLGVVEESLDRLQLANIRRLGEEIGVHLREMLTNNEAARVEVTTSSDDDEGRNKVVLVRWEGKEGDKYRYLVNGRAEELQDWAEGKAEFKVGTNFEVYYKGECVVSIPLTKEKGEDEAEQD